MSRHPNYCFSKASCLPDKLNFPDVPKNNNVYRAIKARSWWFCGKSSPKYLGCHISLLGNYLWITFKVWPVTPPLHVNTGPTDMPRGHATSSRVAASAMVRFKESLKFISLTFSRWQVLPVRSCWLPQLNHCHLENKHFITEHFEKVDK